MKFKLTAAQERRIRTNSVGRFGYAAVIEFYPIGRSRAPVRPLVCDVRTTVGAAERDAETRPAGIRNQVKSTRIVKLNALGQEI